MLVCLAFAAILIGTTAETNTDKTSKRRKLIINGDPAPPTDNQFFVRSWSDSFTETNDVLCGASLIHSDIILTAAHCHGGFNYGAMAYNPDTEMFNRYTTVDLQIGYPKYYQNLNIINYDVMIMRLSSPITDVEPVLLNSDPSFPVNSYYADEAYLLEGLGVGLTETGLVSNGLEVGFFNAILNDQCKARLGDVNVKISDDVICADPSTDDSICAGDSGGPLTAKFNGRNGIIALGRSPWGDSKESKPVQVGITSFGNDCEVDEIPDGFARISYFYEWINQQICKYSRDPPTGCSDYFESEEYLEFVAAQDSTTTISPEKARITMKFQHNFLPEQTVFVFRNTKTNKIEYIGPHYVPRRGEFKVSNFYLPVPASYRIEIHDLGGDGLANPDYVDPNFPYGNWTISAEYSNGARLEELASGDHNFKYMQNKYIKLKKRLPDPKGSFAPTVTPPSTYFNTPTVNTEEQSSSTSVHSTVALAALTICAALSLSY